MIDTELAQASPLPMGTGDAEWQSTDLASPYASGMEFSHLMDGPKGPRSTTAEVNVKQRRQVGRPIIHTGNTEDPGLTSAERRTTRRRSASRDSARKTRERHQELSDQMTSRVSTLEEVNTKLLSENEDLHSGMVQVRKEYEVISLNRSRAKQQPEVAMLLEDSNTVHTKAQRSQQRGTTTSLLQEDSLDKHGKSSESRRGPDRTASPAYCARAQPGDIGSAAIHGHAQQTADTTEVWIENESVAEAICKDMLMCGGSKLIIRGKDSFGYKIDRVHVEEQQDVWHPIDYSGFHQEDIRASTLPQKPRYVWSPEAHSQFEGVVAELGNSEALYAHILTNASNRAKGHSDTGIKTSSEAIPSAILESLPGFGLTREHVASHLQKFRTRSKLLVNEEKGELPDKNAPESSRTADYSDTLQNLSKGELCNMLMRIRSSTQPKGEMLSARTDRDFHQKVDDFDMSLGMTVSSKPMFSQPLLGSHSVDLLPPQGHDSARLWDAVYASPQGLQGPKTTDLNSNNFTGDINGNADVAETGGQDLSWLMGGDFV